MAPNRPKKPQKLLGFSKTVVTEFLAPTAPLRPRTELPTCRCSTLDGNPVVGSTPWGASFSMVAMFLAGLAAAMVLIRRRGASTG